MDNLLTTNVLGAGASVLTLLILYCMLIVRSAGKGSQRLPAAVIPRSRSLHVPPSTSTLFPTRSAYQQRLTRPQHASASMLRGAVQKHEQETARSQRSSQDFFSSPPTMASQPKAASQSVNPGYRDPLMPANSSALNGARKFQPRQQGVVSGTKRTASGLAKLVDGSFDEGPGSRHQPIVVAAGGRGGTGHQTQVTFDENEFDSDVDLEFEAPRSTVSYPKLPTKPTMSAPPKPVVYPALPKQPQAPVAFPRQASPADSGYGTHPAAAAAAAAAVKSPPKSSAELPWSSSPVEHFSSTHAPSAIRKFAYDPTDEEHAGPVQKSSKRRVLPWKERNEEAKAKAKSGASDNSTPQPKDSKKSMYPWNTTASAVKEQQKKFREENRKAIKKNEGTDESTRAAKSKQARPARVFLSEEQQHVLDLVVEQKKSVFFTGSAGTGKSVLLREIISSLRKQYAREPDRVAVTASTGLAACNVGGVTLHSFAGIGLGKEDASELVRKIKKNQKAKHRWMRTKVLIVDEVSMVDADLFDKLETIARSLRNNGRPFGGIQLIITGDFFQLPPVPDSGRVAKFAFDASTWPTSIEHTIGLHHVFRQKDPGMI